MALKRGALTPLTIPITCLEKTVQNSKNKARTPVQRRGIETREKIVEAALSLFSKKGYHKTNALEIAARAGVATGSFYAYFNNKKELLIELLKMFYLETTKKVMEICKEDMESAMQSGDGRRLVRSMIRALHDAHSIRPELHREILALTLLDTDIREANRLEEEKVIAHLTGLLSNFKNFTRVNDIAAAAVLLYRTSEEIIHRIRVIGTGINGERLLTELEDMICRYLLPRE